MTFSKMTFRIMTFRIMTFRIMDLWDVLECMIQSHGSFDQWRWSWSTFLSYHNCHLVYEVLSIVDYLSLSSSEFGQWLNLWATLWPFQPHTISHSFSPFLSLSLSLYVAHAPSIDSPISLCIKDVKFELRVSLNKLILSSQHLPHFRVSTHNT